MQFHTDPCIGREISRQVRPVYLAAEKGLDIRFYHAADGLDVDEIFSVPYRQLPAEPPDGLASLTG